ERGGERQSQGGVTPRTAWRTVGRVVMVRVHRWGSLVLGSGGPREVVPRIAAEDRRASTARGTAAGPSGRVRPESSRPALRAGGEWKRLGMARPGAAVFGVRAGKTFARLAFKSKRVKVPEGG